MGAKALGGRVQPAHGDLSGHKPSFRHSPGLPSGDASQKQRAGWPLMWSMQMNLPEPGQGSDRMCGGKQKIPELKDKTSPTFPSFFPHLGIGGIGRVGGRRRGRRYGEICICIADSLCYTAETNTPL